MRLDINRAGVGLLPRARHPCIRLRDEDHIGDEALRRVQEDLDLEEVLLTNPEKGPGHDL